MPKPLGSKFYSQWLQLLELGLAFFVSLSAHAVICKNGAVFEKIETINRSGFQPSKYRPYDGLTLPRGEDNALGNRIICTDNRGTVSGILITRGNNQLEILDDAGFVHVYRPNQITDKAFGEVEILLKEGVRGKDLAAVLEKAKVAPFADAKLEADRQTLMLIKKIATSANDKVMDEYEGFSFPLNSYLRNPNSPESIAILKESPSILRKRDQLDAIIAKAKYLENDGKPIRLYRGEHVLPSKIPPNYLKEGTIVEDEGFVSTSLRSNVAQRFAKHQEPGDISIINIIDIAPGTKIKGVTSADNDGWNSVEFEIILQRKAKFKVRKVSKINGVIYRVLEVVE